MADAPASAAFESPKRLPRRPLAADGVAAGSAATGALASCTCGSAGSAWTGFGTLTKVAGIGWLSPRGSAPTEPHYGRVPGAPSSSMPWASAAVAKEAKPAESETASRGSRAGCDFHPTLVW